MSGLTPLDTCIEQALHGTHPVPAETIALQEAMGHVLADDLVLPHDLPRRHEALCAGFAVNALDLMGASAALPFPLPGARQLLPGMPLPPGTDAVLPRDCTRIINEQAEAIQAPNPGEGIRRTGHDGRKGEVIARAGQQVGARLRMVAMLAGISHLPVRRPRVQIAPDAPQAGLIASWARSLGALITEDAPHLAIRPTQTHQPRLALAPGDTGWLSRKDGTLVLDLPPRFDGTIAALLALGLPALATLSGTTPQTTTRPVARKITSTIGLSELVLLSRAGASWQPGPAGTVTLTALARAEAFALIPPGSEGIAADTGLPGTHLENPFG